MKMASNEQKINAWFARFQNRMDHHVPRVVRETAIEFTKERFIQKNWDNKPWASYGARRTLAGKRVRYPKSGTLMMRSGNLFRSIGYVETPHRVRIKAGGGKVPYARVNNEGFYGSQTVGSYTNKNFMGRGKAVTIKAHRRTMNIPQRRYMGHSAIQNKRIIQRLKIMWRQN